MAKTTTLDCAGCGQRFDKPTKEVRRRERLRPGANLYRDRFADEDVVRFSRGVVALADAGAPLGAAGRVDLTDEVGAT